MRLVTNGQLDSSFGTSGAAGLLAGLQTLTLLPSGKILVASSSALASGGVTRYKSNGSLDTTFAVSGERGASSRRRGPAGIRSGPL